MLLRNGGIKLYVRIFNKTVPIFLSLARFPVFLVLLITLHSNAQDTIPAAPLHAHSSKEQRDLIDIGRALVLRHPGIRADTSGKKRGRIYGSILPSAEYTLQTGFAANLTTNAAFYAGESPEDNLSNIYLNLTYTQKSQLLIPMQANIWTKGNKYNILTDWRYNKYPQDTYGLGGLPTRPMAILSITNTCAFIRPS